MDIKRHLTPFILLTLVSGSALAANPQKAYVGAQYAMITYSESGVPNYNPAALVIRGGYNFSKYLGVEGRIGFGISDDTQNVSGFDVKLEVDNIYGAYAVGRLPLAKSFDLYGVAGFTSGSLTASAAGISVSETENDLSLGIGAEFFLQNVSFSLEYMSYMRKSNFDVSAFGLGVNYNF